LLYSRFWRTQGRWYPGKYFHLSDSWSLATAINLANYPLFRMKTSAPGGLDPALSVSGDMMLKKVPSFALKGIGMSLISTWS